MSTKQQLKQRLIQGENGQVLDFLLEATEKNGQSRLNGYLVLTSARYHRNERDNNGNLIDKRDYAVECNRISDVLRKYIEEFEDDGTMQLNPPKPVPDPPPHPIPDRFVPLPPQNTVAPVYNEMSFLKIDAPLKEHLVLLVTATDTETTALHQKMTPFAGESGLWEVVKDNATYYLGKFGNFAVAQVECGTMGSGSSMGSIITITNAINDLSPKFVLMVGIAFGMDAEKQNIGDVLVSNMIMPYESQRVGKTDNVNRGVKTEASNALRNVFKNLRDWSYPLPNGAQAELELCDILSGEKLVDNQDFRQALQQDFPTAKGGEMEGAGVYTACQDKRIEWILVKSICDFADGEKKSGKKEKQALAIDTALSACLKVFSKKHVFEGLGVSVYQ